MVATAVTTSPLVNNNTLRNARFFSKLPEFLVARTEANARRVIDYIETGLGPHTLAARQLISLARRLYPIDESGFALLDRFYRERYAQGRLSDVRYGPFTARPTDSQRSAVTRDWYFSPRSTAYYLTWYGPYHCDDLSFALFDSSDRQLLTVPCTIFGKHSLCNFNQPIVLIPDPDREVAPAVRASLVRTALRHLDMLATEYLAYSFLVGADDQEWEEPIFAFASARPHFITVRSQPTTDLSESRDKLFAGLRKSYRACVNAGQRAYRLQAYSGEALRSQRDWIRSCILDLRLRGHETLLPEYLPDHGLELCIHGGGEASLAVTAEGQVVGATVIVDDGSTAMYSYGEFAKADVGPPVSHWMVFEAMLRAKERGMRWFFLSHVPDPRFDFDGLRLVDAGKIRDGSKFFKLGFANCIRRRPCLRIWSEDGDAEA